MRGLLVAAAAALAMAAPPAQAAELARGPSVNLVTPGGALIAFWTGSDCAPQVRYQAAGGPEQVASAAAGTRHAVALSGLTPATAYTYTVETCGAVSSPASFRTAPLPGTRSVHFVVLGDFGTGGDAQQEVVRALEPVDPELYIGVGDMAYDAGSASELQSNYFAPMAPLLAEAPFYNALGNHEYGTDFAQPYLDSLYLPSNNPKATERYYSFDWGHVHFVALDSSCAVGYATGGRCTQQEQLDFVQQDLAATDKPWKVVFFHHPPWSSNYHGSQLTMRNEFGPLFEAAGVDLVLTGHDHSYERTTLLKGTQAVPPGTPGAIQYLVVGNGGAGLRKFASAQPSWSAYRNDSDHGYVDIKVVGGTLSAEARSTGGEVLDRFTLTKQLPQEEAPTLSLAVERAEQTPLAARFIATTSPAGATVDWTFGDGQSALGEAVSHTYAQPGTYRVEATARVSGQTVTRGLELQITDVPGPQPPPKLDPDLVDGVGAGQAGCASAPSAFGTLALLGLALTVARRR